MNDTNRGSGPLLSEDLEHGRGLLRRLHRRPELSGQEERTARLVVEELIRARADEVIEAVGSGPTERGDHGSQWHGVLARFGPAREGATLLRCELDALPIQERTDLGHRSEIAGRGHLCGHDGHMAILLTLARVLGRRREPRSTVWLLFQPAEETGAGARAVLSDPRMQALDLPRAFAIHNLPGFPLGAVVTRSGTMCCASTGVEVTLTGRAAHAAQPETGRSPARALAELIEQLEQREDPPGSEFATVVGAELGEPAFGTAPDRARLFATLRSATDGGLADRLERLRAMLDAAGRRDGLEVSIRCCDEFKATVNDPQAVATVCEAAKGLDAAVWVEPDGPFRWSEDFGQILNQRQGALIGLGAGEQARPLHDPEYVFPEELIGRGATLLWSLLSRLEAEHA